MKGNLPKEDPEIQTPRQSQRQKGHITDNT